MPTRRVITDIPPNDVPFVIAMASVDGGTVVSQEAEPDGEVTLVIEFPDGTAAVTGGAIAPAASATASSTAVAGAMAAATATAPTSAEGAWMTIARKELGQTEVEGEGNNPRIVEYHATTHGGPDADSVPWCSSFVSFCIENACLQGTRSKLARSWMTWGRDAGAFVPGCIVVLQRGAAPKGHVGFCIGAAGGTVTLLGGNQGNAVSIANFDASRVLARRLPP